jgi:hypothetical protein
VDSPDHCADVQRDPPARVRRAEPDDKEEANPIAKYDWQSDGLPDSDGDGLSDYFEKYVLKTNPEKWDSDGDKLSDGRERAFGTNAHDKDSDGDGVLDNLEVTRGTNPWSYNTDRTAGKEYYDGLKQDEDGDGLTRGDEFWLGTSDTNRNSDGDWYPDRVEVRHGSDPTEYDRLHHDTGPYDPYGPDPTSAPGYAPAPSGKSSSLDPVDGGDESAELAAFGDSQYEGTSVTLEQPSFATAETTGEQDYGDFADGTSGGVEDYSTAGDATFASADDGGWSEEAGIA